MRHEIANLFEPEFRIVVGRSLLQSAVLGEGHRDLRQEVLHEQIPVGVVGQTSDTLSKAQLNRSHELGGLKFFVCDLAI